MRESYTQILANWAIGDILSASWFKDSVVQVTTSSGSKYVLKEQGSLNAIDRLTREGELLVALYDRGVPVAPPLSNRRGRLIESFEDKCFCLFPFVEWDHTDSCYSDGTDVLLHAVGVAAAKLHLALKDLEHLAVLPPMDLNHDVHQWAKPIIVRNTVGLRVEGAAGILDHISRRLEIGFDDLPEQLIHRDLHLGNVLLRKDLTVAGFVDFSMARRGARVFDLCYCCTDMLGNNPGGLDDREPWGTRVAALLAGYEEMCPLGAVEKLAMWDIMLIIQWMFTACFCEDQSKADLAHKNWHMLWWLYANRGFVEEVADATRV